MARRFATTKDGESFVEGENECWRRAMTATVLVLLFVWNKAWSDPHYYYYDYDYYNDSSMMPHDEEVTW